MSNLAGIYTKAVRQNLKPLKANWDVGRKVELGDYGFYINNIFIKEGNIRDLGIKFDVDPDDTEDQREFSSEGSTDIKSYAKGSVGIDGIVKANASLEIDFSSEESVFFNAAGCKFDLVKDKPAVGTKLLQLLQEGKWKQQYVIVTELVKAGSTTIVISGSSSSSITLEAEGDVDRINLSDASVKFSASRKKNIGYSITAKEGLIPLIGLSKIKYKFPFSRTLRPIIFGITDFDGDSDLLDLISTDQSSDDLYFGQFI